jgi:hypothetical protein
MRQIVLPDDPCRLVRQVKEVAKLMRKSSSIPFVLLRFAAVGGEPGQNGYDVLARWH